MIRFLFGAAFISLWAYTKINSYQEQQRKEQSVQVAAGLSTGIEPHWYGNHLWLWNQSSITMTNIVVHVVLMQKGQKADESTRRLSALPSLEKQVWRSALAMRGSEIGSGTTITVTCDQLILPRDFTY